MPDHLPVRHPNPHRLWHQCSGCGWQPDRRLLIDDRVQHDLHTRAVAVLDQHEREGVEA